MRILIVPLDFKMNSKAQEPLLCFFRLFGNNRIDDVLNTFLMQMKSEYIKARPYHTVNKCMYLL